MASNAGGAVSVLVLRCSLSGDSNSALLAEEAVRRLEAGGAAVRLLDLRELDLPLCDGGAAYATTATIRLKSAVAEAAAVVFAAPVYNYDLNAAAKNAIEMAGDALQDKVAAFLCAAGGASSYMAPLGLANSLMLDFRCWIVPRFVYATRGDFEDGAIRSDAIIERVGQLADETLRAARALRAP